MRKAEEIAGRNWFIVKWINEKLMRNHAARPKGRRVSHMRKE
jgi:hypothetical protein